MSFGGAGCDRTDERQPRFHGATPNATCSGISFDGPNANAPHPNANFDAATADKPRFNVNFADANDDAAHLDNELHVRIAPFQRRRLRSG